MLECWRSGGASAANGSAGAGAAMIWRVLVVPIIALLAILTIGSAEAQTCIGIQVDVGPAGRRCLRPGGGEGLGDCPECPEMVVVPAGRFAMGAASGEEVYAELDREVQVQVGIAAPLAVGRHAVTQAEFAAFIA